MTQPQAQQNNMYSNSEELQKFPRKAAKVVSQRTPVSKDLEWLTDLALGVSSFND